jgi:hypothetical protein
LGAHQDLKYHLPEPLPVITKPEDRQRYIM